MGRASLFIVLSFGAQGYGKGPSIPQCCVCAGCNGCRLHTDEISLVPQTASDGLGIQSSWSAGVAPIRRLKRKRSKKRKKGKVRKDNVVIDKWRTEQRELDDRPLDFDWDSSRALLGTIRMKRKDDKQALLQRELRMNEVSLGYRAMRSDGEPGDPSYEDEVSIDSDYADEIAEQLDKMAYVESVKRKLPMATKLYLKADQLWERWGEKLMMKAPAVLIISGATGEVARIINGYYKLQDGPHDFRPQWQKLDDANVWLVYCLKLQRWNLIPAELRNAGNGGGWMASSSQRAALPTDVREWQVFLNESWVLQTEVSITEAGENFEPPVKAQLLRIRGQADCERYEPRNESCEDLRREALERNVERLLSRVNTLTVSFTAARDAGVTDETLSELQIEVEKAKSELASANRELDAERLSHQQTSPQEELEQDAERLSHQQTSPQEELEQDDIHAQGKDTESAEMPQERSGLAPSLQVEPEFPPMNFTQKAERISEAFKLLVHILAFEEYYRYRDGHKGRKRRKKLRREAPGEDADSDDVGATDDDTTHSSADDAQEDARELIDLLRDDITDGFAGQGIDPNIHNTNVIFRADRHEDLEHEGLLHDGQSVRVADTPQLPGHLPDAHNLGRRLKAKGSRTKQDRYFRKVEENTSDGNDIRLEGMNFGEVNEFSDCCDYCGEELAQIVDGISVSTLIGVIASSATTFAIFYSRRR